MTHRSRLSTLAVATLALLAAALPRSAEAAQRPDSAAAAKLPVMRIAAPTTLAAAIGDVAEEFHRRTGRQVQVVVDATATLVRRIEAGEAFDVFFSSDAGHPARLVGEGRALPGSRVRYARGVLVLWSAEAGRDLRGPDALHTLGKRRLAIADPAQSPYGEAAIQTLQSLGLEARLRPLVTQAPNGAAAMQLVRTGGAKLGFVALSQVRALPAAAQGSLWIVPEPLHRPLLHEAVVLSASADTTTARDFLAFAAGPLGRSILSRYGFDPHGLADSPPVAEPETVPPPPAKAD